MLMNFRLLSNEEGRKDGRYLTPMLGSCTEEDKTSGSGVAETNAE